MISDELKGELMRQLMISDKKFHEKDSTILNDWG